MAFESKYAAQFTKLQQEGKQFFNFYGPNILVEVLPKEEITTKSGLVLNAGQGHKAGFDDHRRALGLVLLSGDGYTSDPMNCKVGELILMPYNPIVLSEFPALKSYTANTLAIVADADVFWSFKSLLAYQATKELLNG